MDRTSSLTKAEGVGFPPEPWRLCGALHASVWLVRLADIPAVLPQGAKAIAAGGRALVVTAWAAYGRGSVLEYNELMAAVLVRVKLRPAVTVTHIWVDSPASAAGGRVLWGIPKELGAFEVTAGATFEASLSARGGRIASVRFVPGRSLPSRWSARASTAQNLDGRLKLTRFEIRGRIGFGRGLWRFEETGPLAFLSGRRPLISLTVDRMAIRFGVEPPA